MKLSRPLAVLFICLGFACDHIQARPPAPQKPQLKCRAQFHTIKVGKTVRRQRLPNCSAAPVATSADTVATAGVRVAAAAATSAAYPCAVGDAVCYCNWRASVGFFADNDPAVACTAYYWCTSLTMGYYFKCQAGLLFNNKVSACDWPANSVCPLADGTPQPLLAPPSPKPPSPKPPSPKPPAPKPPAPKPPAPKPKPPAPKPPVPKPPAPKPPSPKPPRPNPPPPKPKPPSPPPPGPDTLSSPPLSTDAQSPPPPSPPPSPAPSQSPPSPKPPAPGPPSPRPPAPRPPPPSPLPPLAPPSPPDATQPGCLSDPTCWCTQDGRIGMFADDASGCQNYFWCVGPNQYYYRTCAAGLLFNNALSYCDWAYNVQCTRLPPSPPNPPPPPPSPPASPPPPSPPPSPPSPPNPPGPAFLYGGYYESWSDPYKGTAASHRLATLPSYVNVVYLSFMQPDATYTGGITFAGTGIQFSSDPQVVHDAILLLKARHPHTKVLVAVGGATYTAWSQINLPAIKRFVDTFNLDGVDLDYEPVSAGCTFGSQGVSCATDGEYASLVTRLRATLPRPYILTTAAWSIGAYGQGAWVASQPQGDHTGMSVNMLRTVGTQLDIVNVMSYDASSAFSTTEAYDAYRSLYSGQILMGVEVPPESWGGHVITVAEAQASAAYIRSHGGDGMMIWSLQKSGPPSAQTLSTAICNSLAMGNCSAALFP